MIGIRFETDCNDTKACFHHEMEIIFVLAGRMAAFIQDRYFTLETDDILVINPFEMHETRRESGGHTISLFISSEILQQTETGNISCCSVLQQDKKVYLDILRTRLASLYMEYNSPGYSSNLYIMSRVCSLLGLLKQEFEIREKYVPADENDQKWTADILSYVQRNIDNDLDLKTAANYFHLSQSHFSRKFQTLTGYSFSDYVRITRLNRAAVLLRTTFRSVTDIANDCGFANINTMIDAFRRHFGYTPSNYRKNNRDEKRDSVHLQDSVISYMNLTKFASHDDSAVSFSHNTEIPQTYLIDASAGSENISLPYNRAACSGYAKDLLLGPMQKILKKAVSDIGFQYIFFHGILDQQMNLFHISESGNYLLNYTYVDMALDFVISTGARPWVEFSYTPKWLVDHPDNFFGDSCMNLPDNLEKWKSIIADILNHFINRYGMKEIEKWHFSMEAAVYSYYGVFTLEQYKEYYLHTYRTIRSVVPHAYISAFGLDSGLTMNDQGVVLKEMLDFCKEYHCIPDELCFQSFGCDYIKSTSTNTEKYIIDMTSDQLYEPVPVSADPDIMKHELIYIHHILEESDLNTIPIAYNVWNNTIWQRDLGNDTCFKSAWLVKNILENRKMITCAAIGNLTDYSERSIMNPNVFHGGSGIMTYHGIPKAGYNALILFSFFHGTEISSGNGYLAVRSEDSEEIMIMIYHYCHYDMNVHLTSQLSSKDQQYYDRYYGFEKKGPRSIQFKIRNLPEGIYEEDSYIVNRNAGSSYDIWMNMGNPERFTLEQQQYLEQLSIPHYRYRKYVADGRHDVIVSVLIEPHEIRLICLKKKS